jgi:hypothetical protein
MHKLKKKEVRRAISGARSMLERNADTCDTFEGVLHRGYVSALRTLVAFGEDFLAKPKPKTRPSPHAPQAALTPTLP